MKDCFKEDTLKVVVDYSLDGIMLFEESGEVHFVNKTGLRIVHLENWDGLKIDSVFPDFAHIYKDYLVSHRGEFFESVVRTKSGTISPVEVRFGYVQSTADKCFYAIFRDISTEKQHEKYLHISNILLDLVSLSLSDFIKAQNRETVVQIFSSLLRDILTVTSGTMGFIALKSDDHLKPLVAVPAKCEERFRLVLEDVNPFDSNQLAAFIHDSLHSKKPKIGLIQKDPSVTCHALAVPLLSNDNLLGIFYIESLTFDYKIETMQLLMPAIQAVIVIHEAMLEKEARQLALNGLRESERKLRESINQLKLHEAELIHAKDEALTANKAKSAFLANMSHEIRTPLNVIMGMTELVYNTELNEKQERFVRAIHDASEILLTLVNQILDLSKIEAGEFKLEEQEFNLSDLIKEIYYLFYARAKSKNLALKVHVDPKLLKTYVGDSFRIKQVLINLLGNSIKFTERGFIELKVILKEFDLQKDRIGFFVVDTGIGIDPETQKKLFNSFVQADNSTTRNYGGTGLGLFICKKLVGLMHGTIGLSSTVGAGSTFQFELPLVSKVAKKPVLPWRKAMLFKENGEVEIFLEENLLNFHVTLETVTREDSFLNNAEKTQYDLLFILSENAEAIAEKVDRVKNKVILLVPPYHESVKMEHIQLLEYPLFPADLERLVDSLTKP